MADIETRENGIAFHCHHGVLFEYVCPQCMEEARAERHKLDQKQIVKSNPYPRTITDEASGIEVTNDKHRVWEEGYRAGVEEVMENLTLKKMKKEVPKMTEQKLIERIAKEGVALYAFPNLWNRLDRTEKGNWLRWAEDVILPIIKAELCGSCDARNIPITVGGIEESKSQGRSRIVENET